MCIYVLTDWVGEPDGKIFPGEVLSFFWSSGWSIVHFLFVESVVVNFACFNILSFYTFFQRTVHGL